MSRREWERSSRATALVNGRVVLPWAITRGQVLIVAGTKIAAVVDAASLDEDVERVDVEGRCISPGLVDIHTHGALGHTFNEPTPEAFTTITQEQAARGVTSLLATVSTAALADLVECLRFSRQWMRESRPGSQVLGVHLEGPYFSMEQKGAQDPDNIRMPNDRSIDVLLEHHDVITMMSYAPELPGALDLTARLVELGIVPAAGHSSATEEDVLAAMERGLSHSVHIWSGQSSTVREGPWRKPGLLEATLVFEELTTEMIADNKHLPRTLMRLAYKCKGADSLCVVSDATSGAGLADGTRFRMGSVECVVREGVGMLLDGTAFAGSTTLLNETLPVLVDVVGVPLVDAFRMATLTPASIIGVASRKGSLEPGKDADIAIFEDDFTVWRTMIAGQWAHVGSSGQVFSDRNGRYCAGNDRGGDSS